MEEDREKSTVKNEKSTVKNDKSTVKNEKSNVNFLMFIPKIVINSLPASGD